MKQLLHLLFVSMVLFGSGCKTRKAAVKSSMPLREVELSNTELKPEVQPIVAVAKPLAKPLPVVGLNLYSKTVKETLTLTFSSANAAKGLVKIFDLLGNEVHNSYVEVKQGLNTLSVSMEKLKGGVYVVEAFADDKKVGIKRFTKE